MNEHKIRILKYKIAKEMLFTTNALDTRITIRTTITILKIKLNKRCDKGDDYQYINENETVLAERIRRSKKSKKYNETECLTLETFSLFCKKNNKLNYFTL